MKRHAIPVQPDRLAETQRARRAAIAREQADGAVIRAGFVHTATGVIDMTRRHKRRQPAVEPVVLWIGGAKAW